MTSCRPFELLWKRNLTPSASLLRFAVADGLPLGGHGRTAPTGVKVHVPATGLEKSYSPVSHPAQAGSFDLLVKAYPPRAGGGVGAYICALQPGEKESQAEFGYLAGAPLSPGRWKQIGLVACGTGLAPLYQVATQVLAWNSGTRISMVLACRTEEDILMREELDLMVRNPCFRLHTQLSMPTGGWPAKSSGRITSKTLGDCLPAPDASSMILVCGTDGFVDTVAGPIQRITLPNGQKRKCQGPLGGFLAELGYVPEQVHKF
ncbi:unnamed protein product [Durusdinium trenchii]|uniref:NADH-cytochrome b5 reductase n=1 Tax=Durusdinium trenchii TaxID=1381693 RepID=A0ABP0PN01_9DINO